MIGRSTKKRDGLLLYPHSTSKYLESNQHGIKRDERNFRKYVQGVCYYGNSVLCTTYRLLPKICDWAKMFK